MLIDIVTGNARSGTSVMMKILDTAGIPCWHVPRADEFNPGGYYEDPLALTGDFSQVPDGYAVKCLAALPHSPYRGDARVIIMRRDFAASRASWNRAAEGRGEERRLGPDHEPMQQGTIDAIRKRCAAWPHLEVWYEDLLRNTPDEIYRVAMFLGLPPGNNLAAMADVVKGRSY